MKAFKGFVLLVLDTIFAFPGWAITKGMVYFLPMDHVFRRHMPTLEKWVYSRTLLMRQFDVMFWVVIVTAINVVSLLLV